mgnify:CR=1 FL=1
MGCEIGRRGADQPRIGGEAPRDQPGRGAFDFADMDRQVEGAGWHTAEGLLVGEEVDKVNTLYGKTGWTACIGYGAMILQKGAVNTAIYTTGAVVYGFAMTAGSEPICQ